MRFACAPLLRSLPVSLLALATSAAASDPGVPLLYRSAATERASAPAALAARDGADGARLIPTAGGRLNVSFDAGRFVYLGFSFETSAPFAVSVRPEAPLGSVRVFANGTELTQVAGSSTAWASVVQEAGATSVVVRLERGDARQVPVTISLNGFAACPSLVPNPCGQVLPAAPAGVTYDLGRGSGADAPADVLIPAVTRSAGLRGPVRSDLTLANRTDVPLVVSLTFSGADGARSAPVSLTLAPSSRQRIEDVVGFLFKEDVSAQGVVAIRGFVPLSPGDVTAETYYDRGREGRIGTALPLFTGESARTGATLLAAATDGNPRLIVFSSAAEGDGAAARDARLTVEFQGGESVRIPIVVTSGAYASARIFDFTGGKEGDGLVTVESDDPTLHAVLIRSDPASGSPFLLASH